MPSTPERFAATVVSTVNGTGGSWSNTANALGDTAGNYATWTSAQSNNGSITLAGFGLDDIVPAGATVDSVSVRTKHYVSNTTNISAASILARNASGTVSNNPTLTRSTSTSNISTNTLTGITRAQLADLRVVVLYAHANNTTSATGNVDWVGVTVNYTLPSTPPLLPRLTKSATGQLQRDGVPWRSAGANLFQLVLNDYPNNRLMSNSEIDAVLDKVVHMGGRFVRSHTLGVNIGPESYHLVTGVSGTTNPTVQYNAAVWDVMDYAVAAAARRGIYLMVPLTDELAYFHGGKRQWVNFRRPGTVSLDGNVRSSNSSTQRAAENYFYSDAQITTDFRKYVSDWLNHTNPITGRAYKDEPAIAVVETGNELWTAQDYPSWTPALAAYIKGIAPNVLVADGTACDGQNLIAQHLDSAHIDIVGTHPYSSFTGATVTSQAQQAGNKGKAYIVGEYPWSKSEAPNIESASRAAYNVAGTMLWSLQNDADLHNNGAAYGTDDVSLYFPGKDSTQTAAVSRLTAHNLAMSKTIPEAPANTGGGSGGTGVYDDTFDGSGPLDSAKWSTYLTQGSSVARENDVAVLRTGSNGNFGDVVRIRSNAPLAADRTIKSTFTAVDMTEFYCRFWLRASGADGSFDFGGNGYYLELASWGGFSIQRQANGQGAVVVGGTGIPGFAAGVPVHVEFGVVGTTVTARLWTGDRVNNRPAQPTASVTDTSVTGSGATGIAFNNGGSTTSRVASIDNWDMGLPASGATTASPATLTSSTTFGPISTDVGDVTVPVPTLASGAVLPVPTATVGPAPQSAAVPTRTSTVSFGALTGAPGTISASPNTVVGTPTLGTIAGRPGSISALPLSVALTTTYGAPSTDVGPAAATPISLASATTFGAVTTSTGPVTATPASPASSSTFGPVATSGAVSATPTTLPSTATSATAFRQFKFTVLKRRDATVGPHVQFSEFEFLTNGLRIAGATATAPGDSVKAGEEASRLVDGDPLSKWCSATVVPVLFVFSTAVSPSEYRWTTANDIPGRDPVSWRLEASNDGAVWVTLDERTDAAVTTARNTTTQSFSVAYIRNPGAVTATPGPITAQPLTVASTTTIGSPAGAPGAVSATPTTLGSTAMTPTPSTTLATSALPLSATSTTTFGTLTAAPGPVSAAPATVPAASTASQPSAAVGPVAVTPVSVSSTAIAGAPAATPGPVTVPAPSISSTAIVSTPYVFRADTAVAQPTTLPSATAFGPVGVTTGPTTRAMDSITSTATIGQPTASTAFPVTPASLGSATTFGPRIVTTEVKATPASTITSATLGPVAGAPGSIAALPLTVAAGSSLGTPTSAPGPVSVPVPSRVSAATFGPLASSGGTVPATPATPPITTSFGTPTTSTSVTVPATTLTSSATFGTPSVTASASATPATRAVGTQFGPSTASSTATAEPATVSGVVSFGQATTATSRTVLSSTRPTTATFGALTATSQTAATPSTTAGVVGFGLITTATSVTVAVPSLEPQTVVETPYADGGALRVQVPGLASAAKVSAIQGRAGSISATPASVELTNRIGTPRYHQRRDVHLVIGRPVTRDRVGIGRPTINRF